MDDGLRPRIILFDIDATIVDPWPGRDNPAEPQPVLDIMARELAARDRKPFSQAQATIKEFADTLTWWDYPDFIAEFALDPARVWPKVRAWHNEALLVHDDAVACVQALSQMGRQLAIVSNNPVVGCLLKLERAGLGTLSGTPHFSRIFGSNVLRGQKSVPAFWQRCLCHLDIPGADILMVGDHAHEDIAVPRSQGVEHFALIDRDAVADISREGPVVRLKDLRMLPDLLASCV